MTQVSSLVDSAISDNFVTVFSKSYCPYCRKAKGTISGLNLPADKPVKIFELDELDNGDEIQAYLLSKTGQRTVPNIFINHNHVGGNDKLQILAQTGQLKKLVA
ncbi:glutaredoxin Grx1 [Atractiella rhizophila]|nr:glutaredoxin Grx1 [Atractiella rhizophila]